MHVMKILYDKLKVDSVKSLTEIDQCNGNSMRISEIQIFVNKFEEFEQVMVYIGSFHPILAGVNIRLNKGQKPV